MIRATEELQNFGLLVLNMSSTATIILSFIKGYGVTKQGIDIWKKKSGEKVSPIFFFYNFFYFLLFLTYGIEERRLAIIVNGSLCLLYIPILLGIRKYRGFSEKEIYFIGLMSLIIPISFFFDREQIIFIFSITAIIAVFSQVKEIWKEKKFGALSVHYLRTFFVATIFWGFYFLVTKKWLLEALNAVEMMALVTALILEKKWRPKEK